MMLYLCRHAIAEDAAEGQADADRRLTREGIRKFRAAAEGFLTLEPEVGCILTSPLLRARQTAEILAEVFAEAKRKVDVEPCAALGPGGSLRGLLAAVDELSVKGVVAVGHEPVLSMWIGELCFGGQGRCEMKKGAIAAIELDKRRGTLKWLLQPGQLRALA